MLGVFTATTHVCLSLAVGLWVLYKHIQKLWLDQDSKDMRNRPRDKSVSGKGTRYASCAKWSYRRWRSIRAMIRGISTDSEKTNLQLRRDPSSRQTFCVMSVWLSECVHGFVFFGGKTIPPLSSFSLNVFFVRKTLSEKIWWLHEEREWTDKYHFNRPWTVSFLSARIRIRTGLNWEKEKGFQVKRDDPKELCLTVLQHRE